MTASKSRGATKRFGPTNLGKKILRFKVSGIERYFTVHEDLICRTSTFFKTQAQPNRRQLGQVRDGEPCFVCFEDLNPITKDITYCIRCGHNVHDNCIEEWKESARQSGGFSTSPTCPMCRAKWKDDTSLKSLSIGQKLDPEAVQAYLDWLYSDTLYISNTIDSNSDTFNVTLLKCWAVANAAEDRTFRDTVISTFFTGASVRFWDESIQWAFVDYPGDEEIKSFVIECFMSFLVPGWFKEEAPKWSDVFVRELADAVLESAGNQ
ncbi:hypothetical protein GQ44DRAFT_565109, partial [Phaeosphaeriaceae sp. PMI808]